MSNTTATNTDWHRKGLDHALDLALAGWPVIPWPDQKLNNWQNLATTDEDQITAWFGLNGPYADAYVATVPGDVGITVVDIDSGTAHDSDVDGFETAKELGLPDRALVTTKSRSGTGRHLFYLGKTSSKRIYPGIDRKSTRGAIRVVEPLPPVEDVHERLPREYKVRDQSGGDIAPWNGSALEWLTAHAGQPQDAAVATALDSIPHPFTGKSEMLRVQMRLVRLGAEGRGGVPEALRTAQERWLAAEHKERDPGLEWSRALWGGITQAGGEVKASTIASSHPTDFFDDHRTLLVAKLSTAISDGLAVGYDGTFYVYNSGVYEPAPDVIDERLAIALGDRFRRAHVAEVSAFLTASGKLPALPEIPDERYINLTNGMLDWRSGDLLEHSPEYRSTLQLTFAYDPGADCPIFKSWGREVVNEDSRELLCEVIGYLLMSGNPLQKAVLLKGIGGSGKSTCLRLIEAMLGKRHVSNTSLRDISSGKFEVAELYGMTANIMGDIDAKYLDDASKFKAITGQDRIQAQRKYGQPFSFTPWCVPVFSANRFWASGDVGDHYFRRWVVVEFPNRVMGTRDFSEASLQAEASGIFNLALPALRRLMDRGDIEYFGSAREAMDEFKAASDVVRSWIRDDDRVAINDPGSDSFETLRTEVYSRYREWAQANGHQPMSGATFYERMRGMGYKDHRLTSGRYIQGIAFKAADLWSDMPNRFGL